MSLRDRARRQLLVTRLLQAGAAGLLGAVALGAVARAEGASLPAAAALGGGAAGLYGLLRRPPWARATGELDPAGDPDGLVRAALSVPAEHPFAGRLQAGAAARRLRFRPLEELRPLALLAMACLVAGFWVRGTPAAELGPGGPAAGRPAAGFGAPLAEPGPGGRAPGRERTPGQPEASGPEPGGPGVKDAGPGEDGRPEGGPDAAGWRRVPATAGEAPGFRAGRDFGAAQVYVERYLRLRAEERP